MYLQPGLGTSLLLVLLRHGFDHPWWPWLNVGYWDPLRTYAPTTLHAQTASISAGPMCG